MKVSRMQIERRGRLKKFDFDEILTHRDKFILSLVTSRRVCFFKCHFILSEGSSIRTLDDYTFVSPLFENLRVNICED